MSKTKAANGRWRSTSSLEPNVPILNRPESATSRGNLGQSFCMNTLPKRESAPKATTPLMDNTETKELGSPRYSVEDVRKIAGFPKYGISKISANIKMGKLRPWKQQDASESISDKEQKGDKTPGSDWWSGSALSQEETCFRKIETHRFAPTGLDMDRWVYYDENEVDEYFDYGFAIDMDINPYDELLGPDDYFASDIFKLLPQEDGNVEAVLGNFVKITNFWIRDVESLSCFNQFVRLFRVANLVRTVQFPWFGEVSLVEKRLDREFFQLTDQCKDIENICLSFNVPSLLMPMTMHSEEEPYLVKRNVPVIGQVLCDKYQLSDLFGISEPRNREKLHDVVKLKRILLSINEKEFEFDDFPKAEACHAMLSLYHLARHIEERYIHYRKVKITVLTPDHDDYTSREQYQLY
ncbi:hypothetical protein BS50DRAFT_630464 [Corynespora cassiicola Philippines]|uniref:Uncharacterized protein n=1 Tax=Corynespora cassiicola Philippines TaxID=1448308 RepID=A0A2T2P4I5_CORCC|nr:hypothetical protein BS50DRAFT_630464 [Corynespora cassiicola Philippines]